ncbi:hypothetical protein [Amycolatopsis cihanbeyliensis]|uniref:Uncharacterized protein n=1 Tax=Amycolatopsis cihanbeyliensis TaxID=1128664 RepID=A0A542DR56_AMYCI|nr:hypothetical protein [Amycolatopsis cihanbeyliensis]TQJ05445.1 hypothetical protein FB471_5276 [Amycolatopsis cihanbeyliensis]
MHNNFDELTGRVLRRASEYYDLRQRESAQRHGEFWFVDERLAEMADDIKNHFETLADIFRIEAERFRTGRL